jgi:hypothetical protein
LGELYRVFIPVSNIQMEVDPRLMHKSLDRRQDRDVDWAAMQDLFDAQCEELDTYLSDSANPIWVALVRKVVHLQRSSDTENNRYSLVQSLGILWRRLITVTGYKLLGAGV